MHRRTDTKDVFPGEYDMFVGGVVSAGESYDDSALREIGEELGIVGPTPEFMFMHRYEGPRFAQPHRRVPRDMGRPNLPSAERSRVGRLLHVDEIITNLPAGDSSQTVPRFSRASGTKLETDVELQAASKHGPADGKTKKRPRNIPDN